MSVLVLCSCNGSQKREEKIGDIQFTVVKEEDIPQKFKEMIDTKKVNTFQMTYCDGEFMYLAKGFGEQETGGYSVTVDTLYESEKYIYFDATLIGPAEGEEIKKAKTYPFIVVKFEMIDKEMGL